MTENRKSHLAEQKKQTVVYGKKKHSYKVRMLQKKKKIALLECDGRKTVYLHTAKCDDGISRHVEANKGTRTKKKKKYTQTQTLNVPSSRLSTKTNAQRNAAVIQTI